MPWYRHTGGDPVLVETLDGLAECGSGAMLTDHLSVYRVVADPQDMARVRDAVAWRAARGLPAAIERHGRFRIAFPTSLFGRNRDPAGACGFVVHAPLSLTTLRRAFGLTLERRLAIAARLADALAECRRMGMGPLINLTPDTLFWDDQEGIVIAAFDRFHVGAENGLVRAADAGLDPAYSLPEIAHRTGGLLGEEQDDVAFAAILFELLGGGIHAMAARWDDDALVPFLRATLIAAGIDGRHLWLEPLCDSLALALRLAPGRPNIETWSRFLGGLTLDIPEPKVAPPDEAEDVLVLSRPAAPTPASPVGPSADTLPPAVTPLPKTRAAHGWRRATAIVSCIVLALMLIGLMAGPRRAVQPQSPVAPASDGAYYVTRGVNLRDLPTAESSQVLARLERSDVLEGTLSIGRDGATLWLETRFLGERAYAWSRNLSDRPRPVLDVRHAGSWVVIRQTLLQPEDVSGESEGRVLQPGALVTAAGSVDGDQLEIHMVQGGVGYLPLRDVQRP